MKYELQSMNYEQKISVKHRRTGVNDIYILAKKTAEHK